MDYKEIMNFSEICVEKHSDALGIIKAQNKTKNIELHEEIPKERYISPEKRQKIIDDLGSVS